MVSLSLSVIALPELMVGLGGVGLSGCQSQERSDRNGTHASRYWPRRIRLPPRKALRGSRLPFIAESRTGPGDSMLSRTNSNLLCVIECPCSGERRQHMKRFQSSISALSGAATPMFRMNCRGAGDDESDLAASRHPAVARQTDAR